MEAKKTTEEKLRLFARYFTGLTNVYGTYDPASGKSYQIKAPVTRNVLLAHLQGKRSYGVYLLVKERTRALAADFDTDDPLVVLEFVAAAKHYGIPAYVERSKSKGYHAWIFFEKSGVLAAKARTVAKHLLDEIERPGTEIFPKQDSLSEKSSFGNFINAPLFGKLVPKQRTIFVDESGSLKPYPDQWQFLENIREAPESLLDEIIEINELSLQTPFTPTVASPTHRGKTEVSYGLPPCAQRMLNEGVASNQRVSCFRLAIQLKKAGLPQDLTLAALKTWATKNRPENGKGIITEREIEEQTAAAYNKDYHGCGCEEPAVAKYCDPACPVRKAESPRNECR